MPKIPYKGICFLLLKIRKKIVDVCIFYAFYLIIFFILPKCAVYEYIKINNFFSGFIIFLKNND